MSAPRSRPASSSAAPAASSSTVGGGGAGEDGPFIDDGVHDPVLAEQMRADAERAADAGAAQALSEAQSASLEAQRREREQHAAADQDGSAQQQYDLGQEFAQYAPAAGQQQQQHDRTFLTGLDASHSQANLHQQQQQQQSESQQQSASDAPAAAASASDSTNMRMSDEELISAVEKQMLEYERTAQYLEAEKARQHLEQLKKRFASRRRDALEALQGEDVRVFFAMVAQHQRNFDATWATKSGEHALRAADLIDACKWRHEEAQRELYETLRRKRMPKFSVELLNMRKRQVSLARAKSYVAAERVKRRADQLEQLEVERIRESAREENQLRFQALLKKQEWERAQLASKLHTEKRCLLEAKAQDFLRLKKRLRNAEAELKKTHVRQQMLAEKKILPHVASAAYGAAQQQESGGGGDGAAAAARAATARGVAGSAGRSAVLRNSGMQRVMGATHGSTTGAGAKSSGAPLRSARELAARAAASRSAATSSSYEVQQAHMTQRAGQAIVGGSRTSRPAAAASREEKETF